MKIFEVKWSVGSLNHNAAFPWAAPEQKKMFTSQEKADEFFKQLDNAIGILRLQGYNNIVVNEIEVND